MLSYSPKHSTQAEWQRHVPYAIYLRRPAFRETCSMQTASDPGPSNRLHECKLDMPSIRMKAGRCMNLRSVRPRYMYNTSAHSLVLNTFRLKHFLSALQARRALPVIYKIRIEDVILPER